MSRTSRILCTILSASMLAGLIGCNDPNAKPDAYAEQTAAAEARIRDLQDQLAMAERNRIASQEQLNALRAELDNMRSQMASQPEPEPAAPGWTNVPGGVMTSIEGTVLFDSGKAQLKSTAKHTLDEIARVLKGDYPDHDVYVFGHTDNVPIRRSGWKVNYELSCERALSVVRYLQSRSLSQRMSAAGWGSNLPVADNTSAAARQQNRRVEIYAMRPLHEVVGQGSMASPPSPKRIP